MPAYSPIEERLFSRVTIQDDGCWIWRVAKRSVGVVKHGLIGVTAYTVDYVHRVSWVIHNGTIPEGMFVLHKCDVGECVNPDHLFLGTQTDNMKDMQSKGRARGKFSYAPEAAKARRYTKTSSGRWIPVGTRKVHSGRSEVQGSSV